MDSRTTNKKTGNLPLCVPPVLWLLGSLYSLSFSESSCVCCIFLYPGISSCKRIGPGKNGATQSWLELDVFNDPYKTINNKIKFLCIYSHA